jgi:hypothetical protein
MRTTHFLAALLLVPSVAMSGTAQAIGSYARKPPIPVAPSALPSVPEHAAPAEIPAGQILGGCGARRWRDPQTHKCRGPADFGN